MKYDIIILFKCPKMRKIKTKEDKFEKAQSKTKHIFKSESIKSAEQVQDEFCATLLN